MGYNFWQGEKIKLRAVEPNDFNWAKDYDSEADRTTSGRIYPNLSCEKMKEKHENGIVHIPQDDSFEWTIEDNDGNAVGKINTFNSCDPRVGTFKYGVDIKREFRGKGYAKEAIVLLLRYYFRELRYQKVTVNVYSFNEPSIKLHQRLGYVEEGRIRRTVFTNGSFHDELIFGLTVEEFNNINPIRKINL